MNPKNGSMMQSQNVQEKDIEMSSSSMAWLRKGLPENMVCIPVKADQIQIIHGPKEFFEKLKELSSKSQKRISFAALYLGIKSQEIELIQVLNEALERNPALEVKLLSDYTRGTRIEPSFDGRMLSSKDVLKDLLKSGQRVTIAYYLSPLFSSSWFKKRILFPRQKHNEIVSLQHMKCFVFDDSVIISGANLSESYFTNRNDRYLLVKNCPQLSNYFNDMVGTVSDFSLQLQEDGSLKMDTNNCRHDPLDSQNRNRFVFDAREKILKVEAKHSQLNKQDLNLDEMTDTVFVPLLQMSTFGINEEVNFVTTLLSQSPQNSVLKLASGYFNLTSQYIDLLIQNQSRFKTIDVLFASETVNSFYKAKGLIGEIPSVYTTFSRSFFERIKSSKAPNIKMYSFERPKWTFHSKGLWLHSPKPDDPLIATIGSSNLGWRSSFRDLENQVVILTKNEKFKRDLVAEYQNIWSFGKEVTKVSDFPKVKLWVSIVCKFIRTYF